MSTVGYKLPAKLGLPIDSEVPIQLDFSWLYLGND
jgi:hypothetical protein